MVFKAFYFLKLFKIYVLCCLHLTTYSAFCTDFNHRNLVKGENYDLVKFYLWIILCNNFNQAATWKFFPQSQDNCLCPHQSYSSSAVVSCWNKQLRNDYFEICLTSAVQLGSNRITIFEKKQLPLFWWKVIFLKK